MRLLFRVKNSQQARRESRKPRLSDNGNCDRSLFLSAVPGCYLRDRYTREGAANGFPREFVAYDYGNFQIAGQGSKIA
jgi:hypothetical protein